MLLMIDNQHYCNAEYFVVIFSYKSIFDNPT